MDTLWIIHFASLSLWDMRDLAHTKCSIFSSDLLDSAKALISLYCIRKKGNVPQFSETYANMQHIRQKKSLYNSYEC